MQVFAVCSTLGAALTISSIVAQVYWALKSYGPSLLFVSGSFVAYVLTSLGALESVDNIAIYDTFLHKSILMVLIFQRLLLTNDGLKPVTRHIYLSVALVCLGAVTTSARDAYMKSKASGMPESTYYSLA